MTGLMFLSLLVDGARQLDQLRHFETDFLLNDLPERDISGAEVAQIIDQGTAQASGAGVQLAHAA